MMQYLQKKKICSLSGLSVTEAGKQQNYCHFREPVRLNEKSLLEKADLDKSIDFLDPINEDIPKGNRYIFTSTKLKYTEFNSPKVQYLLDLV